MALKRKHPYEESEAESSSQASSYEVESEDEVDITGALSGKRTQIAVQNEEEEKDDDFEELEKLIKHSATSRDKKEGTKLLKQTKGKGKMAKGEVGGGSFQSMGLHPPILRSLTLRGYKVPTPIQRASIPTLLADPPRDLVGMARTGSGKTLAYMIPLVQRLGGRHVTAFGARALILLPSRELALQVLKVGKDLVRGWSAGEGGHAGDNEEDSGQSSKSQSLRWGLVVGGESLDEQFEMISSNPDVIIATPGRLLHLAVEMNLDFRSVQYVVFDEADRLFEMGFEIALNEIVGRLPITRQTLLFSATIPKSLVEFAKAGLQDPKLVRLDADSKISKDLRMAFFSVKQAEKDACLCVLLRDIIKVPFGTPEIPENAPKKSKETHHASPHQTLIFVATKHHVEYVTNLLTTAGYTTSHIYGSLDQAARTQQMDQFRKGMTNILVVTDVAARGIDIPILANVVNYDFPAGSRVFVHRVGRTARAGRTGWAWSFVTATELPHLLDLQLFLGRPLKSFASGSSGETPYVESLILGAFPRSKIDDETEYVRSLDDENRSLPTLREVMRKGQGMYERSQAKASQASYKRGKEMMKSGQWGFSTIIGETQIHPIFSLKASSESGSAVTNTKRNEEEEEKRKALLKAVNAFSPSETVFELGSRGKTAGSSLMKDRRTALAKARERAVPVTSIVDEEKLAATKGPMENIEMADEEELEAAFSSNKLAKRNDDDFYMSYYQKDAETERGYSLKDGVSFVTQAAGASFDLVNDEGGLTGRQRHNSSLRWDTKKKKFIKGTGEGADNVKMVKTESGTRLPASYRSGRYDEWKSKNRVKIPRVGESEDEGASARARSRMSGPGGAKGGKRYRHTAETPAKPLHKLNKDFERKSRHLKKKTESGVGSGEGPEPARGAKAKGTDGGKAGKKPSRYGGKPINRVRSELKSAEQIRKTRQAVERRKEKNARPSKKGRR